MASRLNLGAGGTPIPGYENLDIKTGQPAYPLTAYADGSVDEVRASHLLEHFGEHEAPKVLDEWVRVLKPGSLLKVAVPDWEWVVREYSAVANQQRQAILRAFIIGGQTDEYDVHRSIWTDGKLRQLMDSAGLTDIKRWESEIEDCAGLPVSLNLQGMKGVKREKMAIRVQALMSLPRLTFSANMGCIFASFGAMGIRVITRTGAFWGQCLSAGMTQALEENPDLDLLFTVDYDTVFGRDEVEYMVGAMVDNPHIDALAGVQIKRSEPAYLFTMHEGDGKLRTMVGVDELEAEFVKVSSAQFGLTCFRAARLRDLPRPWFYGHPGKDGDWGADKIDDDMWFWKQWRESGRSLYMANKVRLGHVEEYITWPAADWTVLAQSMHDYRQNGIPEGARWVGK